jgi:hypothetical protein
VVSNSRRASHTRWDPSLWPEVGPTALAKARWKLRAIIHAARGHRGHVDRLAGRVKAPVDRVREARTGGPWRQRRRTRRMGLARRDPVAARGSRRAPRSNLGSAPSASRPSPGLVPSLRELRSRCGIDRFVGSVQPAGDLLEGASSARCGRRISAQFSTGNTHSGSRGRVDRPSEVTDPVRTDVDTRLPVERKQRLFHSYGMYPDGCPVVAPVRRRGCPIGTKSCHPGRR